MRTIAEAVHDAARRLREAAGEDARLEAEVLLAHAMRIERSHLLARLRDELPPGAKASFDGLVRQREAREPLAYIVGYREFYGMDIVCWDAVLIPRPETEMLVGLALEEIERRGDALRIIDVGTGSGAVAVAIAGHVPGVRIIAADASEDALAVAVKNIRAYNLESRVTVRHADVLDGAGVFDLIVANLPYVSDDEWQTLPPEIRGHEPREALVGGERGTEIIERLIAQAPAHLASGGVVAAEIGETQGDSLLAFARRFFPDAHAYVMKDLAGKDRILVIRREGEGIG